MPGVDHPARQRVILIAGERIPGRMIVEQDDGRRGRVETGAPGKRSESRPMQAARTQKSPAIA